MRSGTLDAPAIAGFAAAVPHRRRRSGSELAPPDRPARRPDRRGSAQAVPDAVLNGDPVDRLPGQRALLLPRLRGRRPADAARRPGHRVLHRLGLLGRRRPAQSHVLLAMGADAGRGPRLPPLLPRPHLDRGDVDRLIEALRPGRRARPPRRPQLIPTAVPVAGSGPVRTAGRPSGRGRLLDRAPAGVGRPRPPGAGLLQLGHQLLGVARAVAGRVGVDVEDPAAAPRSGARPARRRRRACSSRAASRSSKSRSAASEAPVGSPSASRCV